MTLKEAKILPDKARQKRKAADIEVNRLRLIVMELSGKHLKPDLSIRNIQIYRDWKNGQNI